MLTCGFCGCDQEITQFNAIMCEGWRPLYRATTITYAVEPHDMVCPDCVQGLKLFGARRAAEMKRAGLYNPPNPLKKRSPWEI
jgi:hypothetical protein